MTELFLKCHKFVAKWEGGLSDDKFDAGGITKYGVSIEALKDHAANWPNAIKELGIRLPVSRETIKNLTKEQAQGFFERFYWKTLSCDKLPPAVALCVYDYGVNSGPYRSAIKAQTAYNRMFPDREKLVTDGKLGPKSIAALADMECPEGIKALTQIRRDFLYALIAKKPTQKKFETGWMNRVNDLEKTALAWLQG